MVTVTESETPARLNETRTEAPETGAEVRLSTTVPVTAVVHWRTSSAGGASSTVGPGPTPVRVTSDFQ